MNKRFWQPKTILATVLTLLVVGPLALRQVYYNRDNFDIPYYPEFTATATDHWKALGGVWEVGDGAMRNESNDRGAKLLTGSPGWTNYAVEGDVQLLGRGSVGMLGRVSEAELGENSFKGYLAGVRTADHSLFLGAYDFVYREAARVEMPEPIRPYQWYHVRLEVDGCRITASANEVGKDQVQTRSVEVPDCFRSGSVGLRSNGTGGTWRNVRVSPLGSSAAEAQNLTQLPKYDWSSLEDSILPRDEPIPVPTRPIGSLQYLAPFQSPIVSIRGSVVLASPALFVQDSTGGVEMRFSGPTPLKIGDEVDVVGALNLDGWGPVIENPRFRLIRESTPEGPHSVAAHQLAEGTFDGQFVQVEGFLREVVAELDGTLTMRFDAGAQSFAAIIPAGRARSHLENIALGSQLRLRGVSAGDTRFNKAVDPFVILIRSAEGIDVLAGPPVWRPTILIVALLVGLSLMFTFNQFYLMLKNWRLRAIADERERLAHQIHDTLAQSFAGIGFQLQAIRNTIPEGHETFERRVDLAMTMARTSHEEAHRCIANLRPESLDHIVLLPALREYAELLVNSGGVRVETDGDDEGRGLSSRFRDALFRIGKEAITNSIRHANPSAVRIKFRHGHDSIYLSVEDDGIGFQVGSEATGFGLLGMRKRAKSVAATLTVRSKPGTGTKVEVKAMLQPRSRLAWLKHVALEKSYGNS